MTDAVARLNAALSGRYAIEREIGAGGMATVYLARDLRHNRRVAVKVLNAELGAVLGTERFLSEIETTANLQHPHLLPLFDSGEADGLLFYVMPYVEGESLRARLERERQLPVEEAVRIATAVASALDYAHRHDVNHRDLKPENILLHDGQPVVADFGIALAVSKAGGARITQTGLSLGTPQYMSPEQATGDRVLDARTDIYSLASVLYEMLTGEPPHTGSSAKQIIMKIVTDSPRAVHELRKSVPDHVGAATAQALEKLPADRFASAADFAEALNGRFPTRAAARNFRTRADQGPWRRVAIAAGAAAVIGVSIAGWALLGARDRGVTTRVEFAYRPNFAADDRTQIAISRDGRRIVQGLRDSSGVSRLVIREIGSTTLSVVAGSEGAQDPAFSPDGESIVYFADGKTRRIATAGGVSTVIADSTSGGPYWSDDGMILYSRSSDGLWRVPAAGGTPERLTTLDSARAEFNHWYPQALPGGRAAIYNSFSTPFVRSRIEAVEYATGRKTVLVEGGVAARYVPTGHLLFVRAGALFAVPFDPAKLRVLGPAVPVLEDIAWTATDGTAGYGVADNGTLVYLKGAEWEVPRRIIWADRAGNERPLIPEVALWSEPRLSPDGRWLAVTRLDPTWQVWLYDLSRGVLTQLTRSEGVSFNAIWMPDSRSVIHSVESPVYDMVRAPIDGTAPTQIAVSLFDKLASSVSPDGRTVAFHETRDRDRVMFIPVGGGAMQPLEERPTSQRNAAFSPDGRWLAYAELGQDNRPQVFVRALHGAGGRRQVSADGGDQPRWSRQGREIVFRKGDAVLAASFAPATGEIGTPVVLFRQRDAGRLATSRTVGYDVTPDGSQFVLAVPVEQPGAQPVVVVLNWLAELEVKVKR